MLIEPIPPFCQLLPVPADDSYTFAWENRQTEIPQYEPSTWVRLRQPPTAFSFDEAWLLCECDSDRWLAWVPDYGEIMLTTDEFY